MATPLHDVDALVSLARGPAGAAQSWAASRLAVLAPAEFREFPTGEDTFDEVFAAAPPALIPALIAALPETGPCPVGLAASAAALGAYGGFPEERSELVAALRGAMRHDGSEADLWLAYGLCSLGDPTAEDLEAAGRVQGPDRLWLLPALVLRMAERSDRLEEAAAEVARAVLSQSAEPHVLPAILAVLGAPTGPDLSDVKDPVEAAKRGAEAAGGKAPYLPARKGSRGRHLQSLVLSLLDGVPGAPAALLRALYRDRAEERFGLWPIAVAAWLRTYEPGDPVQDVLHKTGGADPERLSAARRAVGPDHRDEILETLREQGGSAVGVLAMPLVAGDPELAIAVCDLLQGETGKDVRVDALACASAWHCADHVPDLLRERTTRDLGLLLAEWTPTEEVLAALLELPVPADRAPRVQYAWCLASMGDAAAVPLLAELLETDESDDLAGPRARAEAILHQPIAVP